jgi:hypothetical protein
VPASLAVDREAHRALITWWLDEASLPELFWARLRVGDDAADVLDSDGQLRPFATAGAARLWLLEDGYLPLDDLVRDGHVPADVAVPAASGSSPPGL